MAKKTKIKRFKDFEHKLKYYVKKNKIKPKKIYPKEKCLYVDAEGKQCRKLAIGKGQLCKEHGGERVRDNYIDEAFPLIKQIKGKVEVYNPDKHPMDYVKLSLEGLSEVEIAAEFKVSVHRLRQWTEDFSVFSEAYDIGQAMYESWWLKKGKEGLDDSRNFNTSLFKFLTGNKLGYSEKVESKNYNINAGVLVVPKTPDSLEEWERGSKVSSSDGDDGDVSDADFEEIKS